MKLFARVVLSRLQLLAEKFILSHRVVNPCQTIDTIRANSLLAEASSQWRTSINFN